MKDVKAVLNLSQFRKSAFLRDLESALYDGGIELIKERKIAGSRNYNGMSLQEFELTLDDGQVLSLLADKKTGEIEGVAVDDKIIQDLDDKTPKKIARKIATHVIKRSLVKQRQDIRRKVPIDGVIDTGKDSELKEINALNSQIKDKKLNIIELKKKIKELEA